MHFVRSPLSLANGAASAATLTPATDCRCDTQLRDVVDDGVQLMRLAGTLSALEFLKARGVRSQVITRVLLDPYRRRHLPALRSA